jgi:hypothetical protein
MIQTMPSRDIDRGTLFMNKFAIGFSILSTLVIGAGCTDEASIVDETPTGNAVFALTNGDFDLTGTLLIDPVADGEDTVEVDILDDSETTLSVELAPGDYNASLIEWTLTEEGGVTRTALLPLDVDLVTVTPSPFEILALDDTAVSINFTIGTDPLVFLPETDGEALVSLLIVEDDGCVAECGEGTECVSISGGAGACLETCDTPGLESAECTGLADCIEGDEGSTVNICGVL